MTIFTGEQGPRPNSPGPIHRGDRLDEPRRRRLVVGDIRDGDAVELGHGFRSETGPLGSREDRHRQSVLFATGAGAFGAATRWLSSSARPRYAETKPSTVARAIR